MESHAAQVREALQKKFSGATSDDIGGEAWQTRGDIEPVQQTGSAASSSSAPLSRADLLRRYAEEAKKQNLKERSMQVYESFRLLFLAIVGLVLSCIIVAVGLPAQWSLSLFRRVQREQQRLADTVRQQVNSSYGQLVQSYLARAVAALIVLTERVTGRPGLVKRTVDSAQHTKEDLAKRVAELETQVSKKKEELLGTGRQVWERVDAEKAQLSGLVGQKRDELLTVLEKGKTEALGAVSSPRAARTARQRLEEFLTFAIVVGRTSVAVAATLLSIPRLLLATLLGRARPLATETPILKKVE